MFNTRRPRRNRKSAAVRALVEETQLTINDFIYPLFLLEGSNKKEEIPSTFKNLAWIGTSPLFIG